MVAAFNSAAGSKEARESQNEANKGYRECTEASWLKHIRGGSSLCFLSGQIMIVCVFFLIQSVLIIKLNFGLNIVNGSCYFCLELLYGSLVVSYGSGSRLVVAMSSTDRFVAGIS